jgi:hypothetical protein
LAKLSTELMRWKCKKKDAAKLGQTIFFLNLLVSFYHIIYLRFIYIMTSSACAIHNCDICVTRRNEAMPTKSGDRFAVPAKMSPASAQSSQYFGPLPGENSLEG